MRNEIATTLVLILGCVIGSGLGMAILSCEWWIIGLVCTGIFVYLSGCYTLGLYVGAKEREGRRT